MSGALEISLVLGDPLGVLAELGDELPGGAALLVSIEVEELLGLDLFMSEPV